MTAMRGTRASHTANSIFAPCRMMPCFSTADPIMKPEMSCRNSSGMPYALHSQTKRAALSDESGNRTPPRNFELFATMPTGRPSSRAKPVTSSFAHSAFISNHEPSSTRASTSSWMSNARF